MRPEELLDAAGKSTTYYPVFAKITGSVPSSLLLAELLRWMSTEADQEGWVTKKPEDIELETGMSKIEFQDAKAQLKARGFLEERQATATSIYYRVITDSVKSKLGTLVVGKKEQAKMKMVAREVTADGVVLTFDMIRDVARATPYSDVDANAIEGFISLYGLSKVISTLDMLIAVYKEKPEPVGNPTLVFARALTKGVTPPENYVSYLDRLKAAGNRSTVISRETEKKAEPEKAKQPDKPMPDMGMMP